MMMVKWVWWVEGQTQNILVRNILDRKRIRLPRTCLSKSTWEVQDTHHVTHKAPNDGDASHLPPQQHTTHTHTLFSPPPPFPHLTTHFPCCCCRYCHVRDDDVVADVVVLVTSQASRRRSHCGVLAGEEGTNNHR